MDLLLANTKINKCILHFTYYSGKVTKAQENLPTMVYPHNNIQRTILVMSISFMRELDFWLQFVPSSVKILSVKSLLRFSVEHFCNHQQPSICSPLYDAVMHFLNIFCLNFFWDTPSELTSTVSNSPLEALVFLDWDLTFSFISSICLPLQGLYG